MPDRKKLRSGFTTGTAAAAAAKGALSLLLNGRAPESVIVTLLTGDRIEIPVLTCHLEGPSDAACVVIKDGGDDPDITHKAQIGARVRLARSGSGDAIRITGGEGVGRVTKPGLEIPPGEPAINLGPRKMITQAVEDIRNSSGGSKPVTVEVFVPQGKKLAKNTLNPRLGILGGISILGTTGVVKPLSHEAYVATIRSALSVARATGLNHAVLTTGRRSERFSQGLLKDLPEEAFVQIGDYFQVSLEMAAEFEFHQVTLAVFFGKAVKMAQGIPHTHASKARLTLTQLSQWTLQQTADQPLADEILQANTARHAFDMLRPRHRPVIAHVGQRMIASARQFAGASIDVQGIIFDYDGQVIVDSAREPQKK